MDIQDTALKARPDSLFCAHQQVLLFYFGERVGIYLSPEPAPRQPSSPPWLSTSYLFPLISKDLAFLLLSQPCEIFSPAEMM